MCDKARKSKKFEVFADASVYPVLIYYIGYA